MVERNSYEETREPTENTRSRRSSKREGANATRRVDKRERKEEGSEKHETIRDEKGKRDEERRDETKRKRDGVPLEFDGDRSLVAGSVAGTALVVKTARHLAGERES